MWIQGALMQTEYATAEHILKVQGRESMPRKWLKILIRVIDIDLFGLEKSR